jgi:hypothetical protein
MMNRTLLAFPNTLQVAVQEIENKEKRARKDFRRVFHVTTTQRRPDS